MTIYLNGKPIVIGHFSGGECSIHLPHECVLNHNLIAAHIINSDDFLSLLFVVNAMRHINNKASFDLEIPYFPYARQDRIIRVGEAFSLEVIANLVNDLKPNLVKIWDPHSKVVEQLVHNCVIVRQEMIIKNSLLFNMIQSYPLCLVCPDDGAYSKIEALKYLLQQHDFIPEIVYATKKRDCDTGIIIETSIKDRVGPYHYLIVDDICDKGETQLNIAKSLKKQGAVSVFLYVTHGLFSKGLDPLKNIFSHIYCFNMLSKDEDSDFLTVLDD